MEEKTASVLGAVFKLKTAIAATRPTVLPLTDKNAPPLQPTKDDMSGGALSGL